MQSSKKIFATKLATQPYNAKWKVRVKSAGILSGNAHCVALNFGTLPKGPFINYVMHYRGINIANCLP